MKNFEYYIFLDYSENLIGYIIIDNKQLKELIPLISKLKHYTNLKYKKQYLRSIKKLLVRKNIDSYLFQQKIKKCRYNLKIFTDIISFIKNNSTKKIFVSIDDKQYASFNRLLGIFDEKKVKIVKEGKLKKDTVEYKMNLIIDTKLNIKRNKEK